MATRKIVFHAEGEKKVEIRGSFALRNSENLRKCDTVKHKKSHEVQTMWDVKYIGLSFKN